MVNINFKDWAHKLDEALWAYPSVFKTPIRMLPHRLVWESMSSSGWIKASGLLGCEEVEPRYEITESTTHFQLNELDEFRNVLYKE